MVEIREDEEILREQAVERLKRKRDFTAHLLAYLMVNTVLIVVWAMTGAGFFWPIFPLVGWGIGLGFHAWDTFSRPPSEERIQEEMDHLRAA
ncbi:MAG TPA: 2TM domain-containing protein [Actinomycetota bacterium]